MATKTLAEWTELCAAAQLTFAPVATLPEYIASEQAQAAGAIATLEHPMCESARMMGEHSCCFKCCAVMTTLSWKLFVDLLL